MIIIFLLLLLLFWFGLVFLDFFWLFFGFWGFCLFVVVVVVFSETGFLCIALAIQGLSEKGRAVLGLPVV